MALCSRLIRKSPMSLQKFLSPLVIQHATMFHENDPKGGYKKHQEKRQKVKLFSKEGKEIIKAEKEKLKEEWKTALQPNPPLMHLDYEIFWQFKGVDSIKDWVVSSDKDHGEGSTEANFTLSKDNKGLFHGNLCTDLPKDGKVKITGYCMVRCPYRYKSFQRQRPYDWMEYSHLIIRCRGDGRAYGINIQMDHLFDVMWHDQYNYVLFTRGGPYWQTAKIPFSKFFLSSKGRIQDKQSAIQLDKVKFLGFSLADQNPGRFNLEIDYIALVQDFNHKEEFAYEMYQTPKGHAGT